jgi:hypothetical protein
VAVRPRSGSERIREGAVRSVAAPRQEQKAASERIVVRKEKSGRQLRMSRMLMMRNNSTSSYSKL